MKKISGFAIAERIVVNTKSGTSIDGILWSEHRGILVLRDARLVENGQSLPMDGEAYIPATEVDFIQKPEVR